MNHLIAIVAHRCDGDPRATFFVDLVTEKNDRLIHSTLCCFDDIASARECAAEFAASLKLTVLDPTTFLEKP